MELGSFTGAVKPKAPAEGSCFGPSPAWLAREEVAASDTSGTVLFGDVPFFHRTALYFPRCTWDQIMTQWAWKAIKRRWGERQ